MAWAAKHRLLGPVSLLLLALLVAAPLGAEDKKAVVIGYDALDPKLMRQWMDEGKLPNFKKLGEQGQFSELQTGYPPVSPAVWSTMTTGLNPGKTGISGFLKRREGSYEPTLALVDANETRIAGGSTPARVLLALAFGLALVAICVALGKVMQAVLATLLGAAPKPHVAVPAGATLAALIAGPFAHGGDARQVAAVFGVVLVAGAVWGYGAVRLHLSLRAWLFPYLALSVAVLAFLQRLPETLPVPRTARHGELFWQTLGKQGIRSKVIGSPVDWPARLKENTEFTTGLATPDVLGTHHTSTLWTAEHDSRAGTTTEMGCRIERMEFERDVARLELYGPPARFDRSRWSAFEQGELATMPREVIAFELVRQGAGVALRFEGQPLIEGEVKLEAGQWSPLLRVVYRIGQLADLHGTVRFKLLAGGATARLYATAVNFDPLNTPDLFAVSAPAAFARRLATDHGLFQTLGWAEATAALNDNLIDEGTFLDTCEQSFSERQAQVLGLLQRSQEWDLLVCFNYEIDRVCHMMWRHLDPLHPNHEPNAPARYKNAILDAYQRADALLGQIMERMPAGALLIVCSDHGFSSFARSVNLNRWLLDQGYLVLKNQTRDVSMKDLYSPHNRYYDPYDWSRTRAYSMGLGKIFLNLKGREPSGIVAPGAQAHALIEEIRARLLSLEDDDPRPHFKGRRVFHEIRRGNEIWEGPFVRDDADLMVGFSHGYRVSWQTALGGAHEQVISDNLRNWSGDHCTFAPSLVPGVVLCNHRIEAIELRLIDVGDSVLRYFGVEPSAPRGRFDGRAWTFKR